MEKKSVEKIITLKHLVIIFICQFQTAFSFCSQCTNFKLKYPNCSERLS